MSKILSQKTFKVELEFTVTMDELEAHHLPAHQPAHHLPLLKRLQQALLHDEPTLIRHMLTAVQARLQEYVDYLAAQDSERPLIALAQALPGEECSLSDCRGENFAQLTRPLRLDCISTRLDSSRIHEKTGEEGDQPAHKTVWEDLRPGGKLGQLLEKVLGPVGHPHSTPRPAQGHYLITRYLTRQSDGIHFEGHCTCGAPLEGLGSDETQALGVLWSQFKAHAYAKQLHNPALFKHGKQFSKN